MAETYSFFNSVQGDRKYNAAHWASYFNKLVTNGIFNGGENLRVHATTPETYQVRVASGYGWINGYLYQNQGDKNITVDVADGVLNRKDIIVLRLNLAERNMETILIKGAPSATPVAPALTRTENIYDLQLAEIMVRKAATTIKETDVTDTRLNTQKCGLVNSLIQADTTAIFNQFEAWYNTKTVEYENAWATFEIEAQSWVDALKAQIEFDDHTQINEKIDLLGADNTTNKGDIETLKGGMLTKLNIGDFGLGAKAIDLGSVGAGNINNLTQSGFYSGSQLVGAPVQSAGNLTHVENRSTGFASQEFTTLQGTFPTTYKRTRTNGTWNPWQEIGYVDTLNIQASSVNITPTAANAATTMRVYFAKPYTQTPSISLEEFTSGPNSVFTSISQATKDYMDIVLYRSNVVVTVVHWKAIAITQAATSN